MKEIEVYIRNMDNVNAVQTLVGQGGIRYMLTYGPKSPNSSYGQFLVKVADYNKIDTMMPKIQSYIKITLMQMQRFGVLFWGRVVALPLKLNLEGLILKFYVIW